MNDFFMNLDKWFFENESQIRLKDFSLVFTNDLKNLSFIFFFGRNKNRGSDVI